MVQLATGLAVPLAVAGALAGAVAGGFMAYASSSSNSIEDSVRQSLGATFEGDGKGQFHVATVAPASLAAAAGLQPGDVLDKLHARAGASSEQLTDYLVGNLADGVRNHYDFTRDLPIRREGQSLTVTFPPMERPPA